VIHSWSQFPQTNKLESSYDFGNFDLCINIQHEQVSGQHCMFQFFPKSNLSTSHDLKHKEWQSLFEGFGGAICLPSTCSSETTRELIESLLSGSEYEVAHEYEHDGFCKTLKLSQNYSKVSIAFGLTTIILLICAILSTIYDIKTKTLLENHRNKWLLTFSIYTNGSNLININKNQPPETIKCLNGIRVIAAISIVYVHSHYVRIMFPTSNIKKVIEIAQSSYGAFVSVLSVNTDFFFVMSGLLVTRSVLRQLDT
jgi:Nose resistant-to-fluoxetine protein, N-terminal domain